jgi:hypothetical protein|tara:strand:+ start:705 stop:986 length:282 start_codon:yes stop_codon:yes gene_type:complete
MATYAKKVWTKEETAAFNQKRNDQKEALDVENSSPNALLGISIMLLNECKKKAMEYNNYQTCQEIDVLIKNVNDFKFAQQAEIQARMQAKSNS